MANARPDPAGPAVPPAGTRRHCPAPPTGALRGSARFGRRWTGAPPTTPPTRRSWAVSRHRRSRKARPDHDRGSALGCSIVARCVRYSNDSRRRSNHGRTEGTAGTRPLTDQPAEPVDRRRTGRGPHNPPPHQGGGRQPRPPVRPPARPDSARHDDGDQPHHRRPGGPSFVIPEHQATTWSTPSEMHQVWAEACLGFMGRTPDYMNVNVMAAGMAGRLLRPVRPPLRRQHGELLRLRPRERPRPHPRADQPPGRPVQTDLRAGRPVHRPRGGQRDQHGIVVRGARMLATLPISDEILIFPSTVLKASDDLKPYALAFALPNNTPGMTFQCREPLDQGRSHADHPLGSRFDELDAMVYFDDVARPLGPGVPDAATSSWRTAPTPRPPRCCTWRTR